ncbi:hypothetical protein D9758_007742 [Tetrapyrgos nigripes]|uniref:Uncharacterized protein n=1 Tax=Tetrapyrgos nigripes TaxID=182062 RepID=A0A8H5LIT0_9AGAR|nr:hypothetical protein D9758_007742 [Tetrapyrgos nigripes]
MKSNRDRGERRSKSKGRRVQPDIDAFDPHLTRGTAMMMMLSELETPSAFRANSSIGMVSLPMPGLKLSELGDMPVHPDLKRRIPILFHQQNRSIPEIEEITGLKKTCIYDTLQYDALYGVPFNPHARRSGRPRTIHSDDAHFIVKLLQQRKTMYLDEIQSQLHTRLGLHVSKPSILQMICRFYFSHKCVSTKAEEANDLLRSHHWNTIAEIAPFPDMLMFTDEASRNRRTHQRRYGWAVKGGRCIVTQHFVRGERVSILPLLTIDGIITHDVIPGPSFEALPHSPKSCLIFILRLATDVTRRDTTKLSSLPPSLPTTILMPRSASPPPNEEDSITELNQKVTITLTVYKLTSSTASKKKKESKETKTKEIEHLFKESKDAYFSLMSAILKKFGRDKGFNVSENSAFKMKFHIPPDPKAKSVDVEDFDEYSDTVKKILETPPSKGITIYVDEKDIKSAKASTTTTQIEYLFANSLGLLEARKWTQLTAAERAVAKKRGLLERQYGDLSKGDSSYKCPSTGESVRLTPYMLSEWARAMVNKKVTLESPPDSVTFDPRTRQSSLLCSHRSSSVSTDGSYSGSRAPMSELGFLSNILDRFVPHPRTPAPTTPPHSHPSFDYRNTPTKLPRFLQYTKEKFGVNQAPSFQYQLATHTYGPDVLEFVDNKDLASLNIPAGEVIRLKKAAAAFMTSDEAKVTKRKTPDDVELDTRPAKEPRVETVALEKRWRDGSGAQRLYGTIKLGDGNCISDADVEWFFRADGMPAFAPVPSGWAVTLENDDECSDDPL